jgi:hypothetical protein
MTSTRLKRVSTSLPQDHLRPDQRIIPCAAANDAMREQLEFLIEHAEEVEAQIKAIGLHRESPVMTKQGLVCPAIPNLSAVCGCNLCIRYDVVRGLLLKTWTEGEKQLCQN